jgi:hypothetical protein
MSQEPEKMILNKIFIKDIIHISIDELFQYSYCNQLYEVYFNIEWKKMKIENFKIAIQCIPGNADATGLYIFTNKVFTKIILNPTSLTNKVIDPTPININGIIYSNLVNEQYIQKDIVINNVNELIQYLITNDAYLEKITKETYSTFKQVNAIIGKTIQNKADLEHSVIQDYATRSQDNLPSAYTQVIGFMNSPDTIDHILHLFTYMDGIKDTNNILNAINNNNILQPSGLAVLNRQDGNDIQGQINSMDEYIASLSDGVRMEKERIRIKYGIIRSTIDFFHDFVKIAVIVFNEFKTTLKSQYGENYGGYVTDILLDNIRNTVTTEGGNVSQTACKNLWTNYAIQFRTELSISFFPISEFGNVGSSEIMMVDDNEKYIISPNFLSICEKLRSLGIEYFYIEAQNTSLGTKLVQNGFGMVISEISKRDAAPGYSLKKAIAEGLRPENFVWSYRQYLPTHLDNYPKVDKINNNNYIITNGPNSLISKYLGIGNIVANALPNGTENITSMIHNDLQIYAETPAKGKTEEFGLNALIETVNKLYGVSLEQLRGTKNANRIMQIQNRSTNKNNAENCILTMALKTYTDFCQAADIEDLKSEGIKTVACSSDFLAARTFSDFFATPTIYVGINQVTVTCSDTRFGSISNDEIQLKLNVFNKLIHPDYAIIFKKCIERFLKTEKEYIEDQKRTSLNAAIYYGCKSLLLEIEQTYVNANNTIDSIVSKVGYFNSLDRQGQIEFLKQFPNHISVYITNLCNYKLSSHTFMESYNNFSSVLFSIMSITGRIKLDAYLDIFYKVEQQLINSLPKDTPIAELDNHLISTYATVMVSSYINYPGKQDAYDLHIKEVLSTLNNEPVKNIRLITLFTKLRIIREIIYQINQNIRSNLEKAVRENFINPVAVENKLHYNVESLPVNNSSDLLDVLESSLSQDDINDTEVISILNTIDTAIDAKPYPNTYEEIPQFQGEIMNLEAQKQSVINKAETLVNIVNVTPEISMQPQISMQDILANQQIQERLAQASFKTIKHTVDSQFSDERNRLETYIPYEKIMEIVLYITNMQIPEEQIQNMEIFHIREYVNHNNNIFKDYIDTQSVNLVDFLSHVIEISGGRKKRKTRKMCCSKKTSTNKRKINKYTKHHKSKNDKTSNKKKNPTIPL